uniref:AB hydrolase-1 domain-containing protein n=1 Tax=Xiphophorus couchianus TaxID=32473 RepID=A0A3B5M0I1_9TELE
MIQALKGVRHVTSGTMKQAVTELCVPVPWGEIRGKIWGPDHGRPVLCLHGWADNCGTFNTLLPLLPKDFRYVAIDLAGHGCSSHRPPGVLNVFPSYVMDMRRVVDVFVCINDTMWCFPQFSALYPEMVDALVLLDSYGFLPTDPVFLPTLQRFSQLNSYKMEEKKMRVYTYEKAVERLLAGNPSLTEESAKILLERGLVKVEGGVLFSRDFRINLRNVVRISLEQSLELQSRSSSRANSSFILFFFMHVSVFQNTVVQVPGNHHVHLNNPEVVAPVVTNFHLSNFVNFCDSRL